MPQQGQGGDFLQALLGMGGGGAPGGSQGGAPGSSATLTCPNCHGPITVSIAPAPQGGQGMLPPGTGQGGMGSQTQQSLGGRPF